MKDLFHDEINNCNHWIAMKIGEGCSWEEIGNLCVPAEQAEEKLGELKQALGIIPEDFCLRDWKEYVDMRKKVSSANTLELSTGEAVPISDACYKSVLQTLTR